MKGGRADDHQNDEPFLSLSPRIPPFSAVSYTPHLEDGPSPVDGSLSIYDGWMWRAVCHTVGCPYKVPRISLVSFFWRVFPGGNQHLVKNGGRQDTFLDGRMDKVVVGHVGAVDHGRIAQILRLQEVQRGNGWGSCSGS
jgi:hypothetical protein